MAVNANGALPKSIKLGAEDTSLPLTVELAPVPPPSYACEPHECDVQDQQRLIEYRAKRQEWLHWYGLHKDVPNNIQQQIFSMLFMDLAYRSVTQPRQAGEQDAATWLVSKASISIFAGRVYSRYGEDVGSSYGGAQQMARPDFKGTLCSHRSSTLANCPLQVDHSH